MRPPEEQPRRRHRLGVPHPGQVLVGHRGRDERIAPRAVAVHPVAHNGAESPDLEIEVAAVPRADAEGILVEPQREAAVPRVESAVDAHLGKRIHARPELRVDKRGEPRHEEPARVRQDQPRRGLLQIVALKIKGAAGAGPDAPLVRAHRQDILQPIKKIVARRAGSRGQHEARDETESFHKGGTVPAGAGAHRRSTSNSVQFSSERNSRKSPKCSRASSRAKFRPRP